MFEESHILSSQASIQSYELFAICLIQHLNALIRHFRTTKDESQKQASHSPFVRISSRQQAVTIKISQELRETLCGPPFITIDVHACDHLSTTICGSCNECRTVIAQCEQKAAIVQENTASVLNKNKRQQRCSSDCSKSALVRMRKHPIARRSGI